MNERTIKLLCETMFDLTWNLVYQIQQKEDNTDTLFYDSRELFQTVYAWAKEFEDTHLYGEDDYSYLEDVDAFFWAKIEEEYPELI